MFDFADSVLEATVLDSAQDAGVQCMYMVFPLQS